MLWLLLIPYFAAAYILWVFFKGRWRELHWSFKLVILFFSGGYIVDLFAGLTLSILLADVDLYHLTLSQVCQRNYWKSKIAKFIWDTYIIVIDKNHLGGTPPRG